MRNPGQATRAKVRFRGTIRHDPEAEADAAAEVLAAAAERLSANQLEAVRKDAHVWELALAADRRVPSNDDAQRALLVRLVDAAPALADLAWVSASSGAAVGWLADGASRDAPYRLGA